MTRKSERSKKRSKDQEIDRSRDQERERNQEIMRSRDQERERGQDEEKEIERGDAGGGGVGGGPLPVPGSQQAGAGVVTERSGLGGARPWCNDQAAPGTRIWWERVTVSGESRSGWFPPQVDRATPLDHLQEAPGSNLLFLTEFQPDVLHLLNRISAGMSTVFVSVYQQLTLCALRTPQI